MKRVTYDLYNVETLEGILGNDGAVGKLRGFAASINRGSKNPPLLVYGPSGIGKSAAVHLLAKENNWNVVELNASDYRNKETIETRLVSAATSKPLFSRKNLILLDEIDELAAGFDKGSGAAISNLLSQSKQPVIFIANDMWDQSISFLRGKVEPVEFKKIQTDVVQKILLSLHSRFSLDVSKSSIEIMANRANGDARSAINDLSVLIGTDGNEEVTEVIGLRDRKIDVFNLLDKIFLTNSFSASLRSITNSDLTNDMLIKWIDENIPKRYRHSEELYGAFDSLALATVFGSRATRTQYYTYWRYMNVLTSSGVALSKTRYPDTRFSYSFPKVIKELSGSKTSRGQDKIIASKLQRRFHSSLGKIIRNEMRLISQMLNKSAKEDKESKAELSDYLSATYQLDDKEISYLLEKNN